MNKNYRSYYGAMGEHAVATDLLRHGYQPHFPLTNNCAYDLLVTKGSIRFRVQVKYRKMTNGKVEMTMRRRSVKSYFAYNDDFDIVAVVTEHNNNLQIAYLTTYEIASTITLRLLSTKNKQKRRVKEFNKYKCINAAIIRARDQSNSRLGKASTRNTKDS